MRPYIAIIKDSFHEALSSRVLWVLLLLISLLLAALVPFHWQTTIAAELIEMDIRNIRNLTVLLQSGADEDSNALTRHVWKSLQDKTRQAMTEQSVADRPGGDFRMRRILKDDFNRIIAREDFFDEALWNEAPLSDRAKVLRQQDNLTEDERKQFNRLALEAALPGQLRPCPDEAVLFRYAKWDLDFIPPLRRSFAEEQMDTFVMAFMAIFVGFFGIFAGVLVTAPIIPDMLNSGSLYVLLSKPVSRPLTFLAKFTGGCSFVLINAAYLILGLWLILGARFGIWKPSMLWSIPIFLFSFAIFYCISALSGLVWRSAVMAIVATIIFWFACKAVAITKESLEQLIVVPDRVASVVAGDGEVFVNRRNGEFGIFNQSTNMFDAVLSLPDSPQNNGPESMLFGGSPMSAVLYDENTSQLIALDRKWARANLIVGKKDAGFRRESSIAAPQNAHGLYPTNGQLLTVADGGVYDLRELISNQGQTSDAAEMEDEPNGINIFGWRIPGPKKQQEPVANDPLVSVDIGPLPGDARVAFDASTSVFWLHGGRKLRKLERTSDQLFAETATQQMEELVEVTHLAAGGGVVVLGHRVDERVKIRVLDGETLQLKSDFETDNENELRQLAVAPNGRWIACLFENDQLEVMGLDPMLTMDRFPSQGSIVTVQFNGNSLWLVDGNDKVNSVSLDDMSHQTVANPKLPMIRTLYRYIVRPLYLIFPKPAELQNTMQYAITGKDTVKVQGPGMGQGGRTIKLNPWEPLISNSIFIAVMLMLGCIYVYRQDF